MESPIDDEKVVLSVEIQDALNALNGLFGKDLFLAKFDTCCAAFEALKGLSAAEQKRKALGKHFRDWIARCTVALQKWVPKYAALAHPAGIPNENKWKWVEDRITRKLRSMCIGGDRKARWGGPIETWEPIQWWIRNACHKAAVFGILRSEPWKVPKWLAPTRSSDPIGYYHTILQAELGRELSWAIDLAKIEAVTESESAPVRPEESRSLAQGRVSVVGPSALLKPGEGKASFWSRLSEDLNNPAPAIRLLQTLGFSAEGREWPSSFFGPVLPDVLTDLKRAHQILTTMGFRIVDDPVNPLGDGRGWVLRCELTDKLPDNIEPADLADQYLASEGIKVAARPVWDNGTLLVTLCGSGRISVRNPSRPKTSDIPQRAHRRAAFVDPLLRKEGWSTGDWAQNSNVDFHTANDYLKGRTKPTRSTRKRLAESLSLAADDLPE